MLTPKINDYEKIDDFHDGFICAMSMTMDAQTVDKTDKNVQPSQIAIYVSGDVDEEYNNIIYNEFVNWISKEPCFKILTRDNGSLNAIVREENYQVSGNVSEDQIRKFGKQAGAEYVLNVNTLQLGRTLLMTVHMINVETAKIVYTTKLQAKVYTIEEVLGLAGRCARKVYQDFQNRRTIE